MPKLGMVMSEGVISKFLKNKGDKVSAGNVLAQIETEKINYDLEATVSGIFHPVVDIGQAVEVNGLIGYILVEGEQVPNEEESLSGLGSIKPKSQLLGKNKNQAKKPDGSDKVVKSTPGARRLAMKLHVDLAQVEATGPGGRITEDDVKKADSSGGSDNASFPALLKGVGKVEELSGMRKSIASHMKNSLSSTAQLSFFLELDVTDVQAARKSFSSENDITITMAHILIKACAESLKRYPEFNTILSDGKIAFYNNINVGFAVAIKGGLVVPVINDAVGKNILEIRKVAVMLADKAREGNLTSDDIAGGTFTISVLGSVDGFTPILNAGQSAILGVGRSLEKPIVRKGEIVIREMITLSLTVDHQVIDGAAAASFLRRLQQILTRPLALLK
jgi:pyruvate dehydrogenase E2 component (dihydrolipoamide acetyltransferase)